MLPRASRRPGNGLIVSPYKGASNDQELLNRSGLLDALYQNMPSNYYLCGDKAYTAQCDAPVALKTSVTPLRLTKEDVAKKPDESENVVDGASHGVPTQKHPAEPGPE